MFRLVNKLKNRKGFTLIELIVVLAVLAVIMAIAVPRFLGVQTQAKIDADNATLALIAETVELYNAQAEIIGYNPAKKIEAPLLGKLQTDFPDFKLQAGTSVGIDDLTLLIQGGNATVTYIAD